MALVDPFKYQETVIAEYNKLRKIKLVFIPYSVTKTQNFGMKPKIRDYRALILFLYLFYENSNCTVVKHSTLSTKSEED